MPDETNDDLYEFDSDRQPSKRDLYDAVHAAVEDALAEHHTKESKTETIGNVVGLLLLIWLGVSMFDYFSYAPWINRIRYSITYDVERSQVKQGENKLPSDCDFLKSPIGFKGCRYKKHVDVDQPSLANGNMRSVFVYWTKEDGDN